MPEHFTITQISGLSATIRDSLAVPGAMRGSTLAAYGGSPAHDDAPELDKRAQSCGRRFSAIGRQIPSLDL